MIVSPDAEAYAEAHSTTETALLRELREVTRREMEYDDMLSGPVVGAFLQMLVRMSGARRVLEVGTFTGYATIWMAGGLPSGGRIRTCESNEKYALVARRFFKRYQEEGGATDIRILFGPALQTIRESVLSGEPGQRPDTDFDSGHHPLDFVFLDADKEHYPDYYELLMPALSPGGIMVIDNVLWGGKVCEAGWVGATDTERNSRRAVQYEQLDRKTAAIHELNRRITDDKQVENVLLSVRDGLQVIRKK